MTPPLTIFLFQIEVSLKEKLALSVGSESHYNGAAEAVDSPSLSAEVESPPAHLAGACSSVTASPKPHTRPYVRADLGNHGRTSVPVKQGVSLRDALGKAMKLRKLTPETCAVYRISDKTKTPINWDTDMIQLEGEDIKVEVSDNLPITTRISHNFVRKTFFSLAFCECCRRLLINGFCCRTCGFKFHQKCATKVPKLRQQVKMQKILAMTILAGEQSAPESMVGIIMPGLTQDLGSGSHHPFYPPNSAKRAAPISSRDRSSSAPNFCNIMKDGVVMPDQYRAPLRTAGGGIPGMRRMTEQVSPATSPTGVNTSSSRSESSSPTSVRPRQRASSADDSSKKEIKRDRGDKRETMENWEIPMDEIFEGNRIGAGSFGTVFRGHWHGAVAIKKLNVQKPSPAQITAFRNEVAVLRKTRHVNVLLFMGCVSKRGQLAIVTQWCEGSSLYKVCRSEYLKLIHCCKLVPLSQHLHVNEAKFELLNVIEIARQTSQGMDYLHAKNIIHRYVTLRQAKMTR